MSASKMDLGPPSKHILKSNGADTDLSHFYITQNSTTYGRKFASFQPRTGRHVGTGYASNFRPQVYYTSRLDEIDNPAIGHALRDNYHTITEKSFGPLSRLDGTEKLPIDCKQNLSGFTRETALSGLPNANEIRSTFIDSRSTSAPLDYRPRHRALLAKIQPKDPIAEENFGYGPVSMKTETKQQFQGRRAKDESGRDVARFEMSGFTHNQNPDPVTLHPDQAYKNDMPGYYTNRPTGISTHTTSFKPFNFNADEKPLPELVPRGDRGSGFVNSTKPKPEFCHRVMSDAYDKLSDQNDMKAEKIMKNDPAEYINMLRPNNHSTISKNIYTGQQLATKTLPDLLNTTSVGLKENTGFSSNEIPYVYSQDKDNRFVTHYQTKFHDRTPVGQFREGHTFGNVQNQLPDGFTKSTSMHKFGKDINTAEMIHNRAPYQARSNLARDQFFDDHTYDKKLHVQLPLETTQC